MEIKLKAEYKNNVRAKHLLKLMKLANSDKQTKQTEAVKVFMLNLAAAGPVDLISVPKDLSPEIVDSMIEVMHLKSRLFEDLLKTGKKVLLSDIFDVPAKKMIKDIGPTTRLISQEAFAKALGAELITDPKEIDRLKRLRASALGPVCVGVELGCEDIGTLKYYDIADARKILGKLVSSVVASGKAVTIGKHGKPIVIIEPVENYGLGEGYVPKLAVMIAEHLLGRHAPFHIRRPQAEELAKLPLEKIVLLLKIDRMPIEPELRKRIVAALGDEVVISRLEKRYELAEAVARAKREGRYEMAEHATGDLVRDMFNEASRGFGDIYDKVYEKIKVKLRHEDFKVHTCVPFGYRWYEDLDDVLDITVDTKAKKAEVKCKDGHIIEFGYDPDGRFNEWAHGARRATPEEMEYFKKHKAIRDKLIEDNRAGKITDKQFDAELEKDRKICEKELRRRWREMKERKQDLARIITDKFFKNAQLHLKNPQFEELSVLNKQQLIELMKIDKLPVPADVRLKIVASIGNENIINRMEKRWRFAEAVRKAEEKGLYEMVEHATGDLVRDMFNEATRGFNEIYNQVHDKIKKKLRHTDFKMHPLFPAAYRGFEMPEDVTDITVDTKNKRATVKFSDGHDIEFGF